MDYTAAIAALKQHITDIGTDQRPGWLAEHWKGVHNVLKKTGFDQMRVGRIVAARDIAQLNTLIEELASGGGRKPERKGPRPMVTPEAVAALNAALHPAPVNGAPSAPPEPIRTLQRPDPAQKPVIPEDTLHSAMKAFKKRMKLTQLNEDSKLSNRALTGGSHTQVAAIQPPNNFPREVWDALADRGNLKRDSLGFYKFLKDWQAR